MMLLVLVLLLLVLLMLVLLLLVLLMLMVLFVVMFILLAQNWVLMVGMSWAQWRREGMVRVMGTLIHCDSNGNDTAVTAIHKRSVGVQVDSSAIFSDVGHGSTNRRSHTTSQMPRPAQVLESQSEDGSCCRPQR